jgi:hypothetical protein
MSVSTFSRILNAHATELDEGERVELERRVRWWSQELKALRNSWSKTNSRETSGALRIDRASHIRCAAQDAPVFAALGLRFRDVLAAFELPPRRTLHKKAPLFELFELVEDASGGAVEVRSRSGEWDAARTQRAALCEERASVCAGDVAEAALKDPRMREFRAWALGYLAMEGTCPSSACMLA